MSHVMARIRIASLSTFLSDPFQAETFGFALTAGHGDAPLKSVAISVFEHEKPHLATRRYS